MKNPTTKAHTRAKNTARAPTATASTPLRAEDAHDPTPPTYDEAIGLRPIRGPSRKRPLVPTEQGTRSLPASIDRPAEYVNLVNRYRSFSASPEEMERAPASILLLHCFALTEDPVDDLLRAVGDDLTRFADEALERDCGDGGSATVPGPVLCRLERFVAVARELRRREVEFSARGQQKGGAR